MDIKTTTTTTIRYRIESKPEGGFIAVPEEGAAETLEGATREQVQQKIDDKLTELMGEMLHNDKLKEMVGELLHNPAKTGGVNFKLVTSGPANRAVGTASLPQSSEPQFESSNKLWIVLALLVAILTIFLYLVKR